MTTPATAVAARHSDSCSSRSEFVLSSRDFKDITEALHADTGIFLPESKSAIVYSRLSKRLRALGLRSFRQYCALLTTDDGVDERQRMIAALTTNVTRFFREPHHFEHLRTAVLPQLVHSARHGGRIRIWSAGCSSGQEVYSTAISVLVGMPDAGKFDVKILATDIDHEMTTIGARGVYSEAEMLGVPADLCRRWFTRAQARGGVNWKVCDEVRRLVTFRDLNLIGPWPMTGQFDAIFCRNTVIYFEEQTQSQVWERFVPVLRPGGVLYIGHSERLCGPAAAALVRVGLTAYRLPEAAAK